MAEYSADYWAATLVELRAARLVVDSVELKAATTVV